jgi:DNA modification methylase
MKTPFSVHRIELWPIDKLLPYLKNARIHSDTQVAQIAASIRLFGFVNPILVGPDGRIIAGHARALAAREAGLTEVPVIVLDHLSPAECRALVIADNRLAENASWDEDMLALELAALRDEEIDLNVLGFEEDELAELLAAVDADALTDEDAVPEIPETPVTISGDLWLLGNHRLLAGDATARLDVERLMAGELADLVFTDLPYNVDYKGYTEDELTIQGDRMGREQFQQFLKSSFQSYRSVVKPSASMYVCHSSSWQREFQDAIEQAGFAVRCQLIWAKSAFAWGFGRYKFQHEPIFYCHVEGEKDAWFGDKSQSTLWEEKKPAANRLHPTMKPISLITRALENSSNRNDIIADFFAGAGSALIGSERLGRRARLMEIEPKYCDCIVVRWQEHTGKKATLEGDGRSYEEVANQRQLATA